MSTMSSAVIPTASGIVRSGSRPRLTSRMNDRIAASRARTSRTGAGSPAVNSSARYSTGMRSVSMAPNRLPADSPSCPVSRSVSTTGDSGGMYQTIGSVRYSGCSGSATSNRLISAQTGERCAASTQSRGMPASSAAACTAGSAGSRNTARCARYRSCSSGTLAASSTRSASYRTAPM